MPKNLFKIYNETNNINTIVAYCFLQVSSTDILLILFQDFKRNFVHDVVNRMKAYSHVVWERIQGIQIPSRNTKYNIDNFYNKRKIKNIII